MDGSSDPGTIGQIQQRLASLGWLEGDYQAGQLDDATMQAVRDFADRYNSEFGGTLYVADSSIGPDVVSALMSADGDACYR